MEARARQAAPRAGRPQWLGPAAFRRTFVLQDSVIKILIIFYVSKRRGHPGVGGRHMSLVKWTRPARRGNGVARPRLGRQKPLRLDPGGRVEAARCCTRPPGRAGPEGCAPWRSW